MSNNNSLKVMLISIGLVTITILLAFFLQSRSPLDLFYVTLGMIFVILGFFIDGERGNLPLSYFVAMIGVNLFQWLILIYIFFMDPVYVTETFLYLLFISFLFTIGIIIQIRRNKQKFNGNHETSNEDKISTDNKESMWSDIWKIFFISVGSLITIGCLISFLFSNSSFDLYGSSIGMITIVYGFFREDKKFNVTKNSSLAIFAAIAFQWLILIYIWFNHLGYSRGEISLINVIALNIATYFFIQMRKSELKYIGRMRTGKRRRINYDLIMIVAFAYAVILLLIDFLLIKNIHYDALLILMSTILFCVALGLFIWKIMKLIAGIPLEMEIKDNGYLVCNECNRYYELQADESPEDFTDQCECGGKLQYQDSI